MKFIKSALALVKENRSAYMFFNILFYGLVLIFMAVAYAIPEVQKQLWQSIGESFTSGPLALVGQAYSNAEVLKAITLTFLVNLLAASVAYITLPSLIVPFSGILLFAFRAILWGLLFSPVNPENRLIMIPHSLTLVLEGQAYILVMFGAYLQGKAFLLPHTIGIQGYGRGYIEGLRRTGLIYLLVTITLLIAAVYEVIEVILMTNLIG